jgi:oxygen-independent coproporphyrinogen-3 oxidase
VPRDIDRLLELLPRYDQAGPRYTSYPTAPAWRDDFGPNDARRLLARVGERSDEPLSLYVHVPFCSSLCHFCACNRIITRKPELPARYLDVLERELDAVARAIGPRRVLGQVHLGGGTPTHLDADQLQRLFRSIRFRFDVEEGAELSIEVDPRVTGPAHAEAMAEIGITRLSMGVQDFDPQVQEAIHRVQSVAQVEELVRWARGAGLDGVNFDLIYGLPFQTEESFARTLDEVERLLPDRIALYSYAHVTWVAKQQRGFERGDLPSADRKLRILLLAIRRLEEAGYAYIGLDHFVREEDELAEAARAGTLHRNFMGYTTRPCRDLVACGPSGISELEGAYLQSTRELGDWDERVQRDGLATFRGHELSDDDRERAWIIKSIMCRMGVSAHEYRERFHEDFATRHAHELELLRPLAADGLVEVGDDGGLTVTADGQLLLRNIAMAFDAYLPEQRRSGGRIFSQTI